MSTITRSDAPLKGAGQQRAKPKSVLRLDIQGLRAVAVLAVIADHLFHYPHGGYVGVDVFFVISGFLITGALLREQQKEGRISFLDFYKRRVRRILPASILVLLVTMGAAWALFATSRARSVTEDGLWAMVFSGNWRFAASGTDYMSAGGPVSPLQHFWSLGVEEQFYFVWPLVIVAVFAIAGKLRWSGVATAGALTAVLAFIVGATFAYAMWETSTSPTVAYFSTISRAWELGIGALLATGSRLLYRIPDRLRPFLAYVGLVGIVGSMFLINRETTFPGPWAALPVLATALVIAAGTGGDQRHLFPLTNPVSGYIGNISYSLYLWHFPVLIFAEVLLPLQGAAYLGFVLALMLTISIASFHYVEEPFRKPWKFRRNRQLRVSKDTRTGTIVGLSCLAVAAALVSTVALEVTAPKPVDQVAAPINLGPTIPPTAAAPETPESSLATGIQAALAAQAWPVLVPSVDNVMDEGAPDEDSAGCGLTRVFDPTSCNFPTGGMRNAVVYGDSTGITLLPIVRASLGQEYNVRGLTMAGCLVLDVGDKSAREEDRAACEQFKGDAVREIVASRPGVVFITNTSGVTGRFDSPADEWRAGTESTLTALQASGAQLIVVSSPPQGKQMSECATRVSKPDDCEYTLPAGFTTAATASQQATATVGASFIDTRSWFCNPSGSCPSFVGTTPVKRDAIHTTKQYAAALVPVFTSALAPILK